METMDTVELSLSRSRLTANENIFQSWTISIKVLYSNHEQLEKQLHKAPRGELENIYARAMRKNIDGNVIYFYIFVSR